MKTNNSSGNVLFLILIAVALFAALSYAVSQSNRGGGQGADREVALTNTSVIQQYPANIRGSTSRMMVNGIQLDALKFNPPSDFSSLTDEREGVFHPNGGAIIYENAPPDVMQASGSNPSGQWVYSLNFEVSGIGTNGTGSLNGNDLTAFLVGVNLTACQTVNQKMGISISPIPTISNASLGGDLITNKNTYYMDHDYAMPATEDGMIGAAAGDAVLAGKYEGCYEETATHNYVFYSVIVAR